MRNTQGFDGVEASLKVTLPAYFAGNVLLLDACTLMRNSGEAIPLTQGELALLLIFVTRQR